MDILLTGGAGYVGSITAEELVRRGDRVIVFDNLEQGHIHAVPSGAEFVYGDLKEIAQIVIALRQWKVEAVIHLAGETVVGESMTNPYRYFLKNVIYGINLLEAMRACHVDRIVFSSTSAIYGEPLFLPITEDHPQNPINSYGESKAIFERILKWYHHSYGFKVGVMRYFNACGASDNFGEDHHPETHLLPVVLQTALGIRDKVHIFGTDYDTKDGTCVRDLTHVVDIAQAHMLTLDNLDRLGFRAYNLGNAEGYTVLDVIETARRITGVDIPAVPAPRRPGDPVKLVASAELIKRELGWSPQYPDLPMIIESAWKWHRAHPRGYSE